MTDFFFLYLCHNVCPERYRGVHIRGTAEFSSHLFLKNGSRQENILCAMQNIRKTYIEL